MLGSSISGFIFIMASSIFGMPVSGTHAVVGALIGSGIATQGASNINWDKLTVIVASWFVAPVLSIILCALFFMAVCALTLDKDRNSFRARLLWLTLFTGIAFTLICLMFLKLIQEKDETFTTFEWTCLGLSPVLGVFITRIILVILTKTSKVPLCHSIKAVFKFWSAGEIEYMMKDEFQILPAAVEDERNEQPLI